MRALSIFVFVAACHAATKPPVASNAPDAAPAPIPSVASAAAPSLPSPAPIASGPIRVVNYPLTVSTGMNDPADVVGFTSDGEEYGYCDTIGAREPPATRCDFVRRDGTHHLLSSDENDFYSAKKAAELGAWVKTHGVPTLRLGNDWEKNYARPLRGTWAYSDITVWVNPVQADGVTTNARVRLGGAVDGEQVVYPISLSVKAAAPGPKYHTSLMNDLGLSPDGKDIGAVASFFCMEWCNDFAIYRAPVGAFASLVYNDTGYRHHEKGEWARAAELFTKAAAADPTAKLPPYNLACALARLGDPRAKDALAVAIARDPDAKRRAPLDADFASVKSETWFQDLVR